MKNIVRFYKTHRGLFLSQLALFRGNQPNLLIPWDAFKSKHSAGDRIEGIISSLKTYGAFIDIMPGIRGLLHISKVGDEKFHRHAKEVFKVGGNVKVWIENIDDSEKKIALTGVEPGVDLSIQMDKLKKESDKEEKASSGNAFGRLLDNALQDKK